MTETVVLLGGTFDPVHLGHLAAAEGLSAAVAAEATWLVPSYMPPHRPAPAAPAGDRLEMVQLAVADRPRLGVSACEVERRGVSFTRDTVAQLQARHPGVHFWLGLGADAARGLPTWDHVDELLQRVPLLLYERPGAPPLAPGWLRGRDEPTGLTRVVIDTPAVSATGVRARLGRGDRCDDVLPAAVAAYIAAHGLYRERGPARSPRTRAGLTARRDREGGGRVG
ncbi:MAG TPA: nicotinate (nicotinamide) nucleotide adenylyltransferase [Verrucomicrobiae bacterium]|nr:nicotinate (nicotinamide) nucleotide adenylyltransferase [Verrucomicrobiae bacterium]